MRVGDRDAALEHFRLAHARFEAAMGASAPDTVDTLTSSGIIL